MTQYVDRNREKLFLDSASAKPLPHPFICEDEKMNLYLAVRKAKQRIRCIGDLVPYRVQ